MSHRLERQSTACVRTRLRAIPDAATLAASGKPSVRYEAASLAVSSSYSAYACSTSSRMRSCALVSAMGRSSAKLRRSPLTAYWRAGNVTLRPPPPRRSQMEKPISFKPSSYAVGEMQLGIREFAGRVAFVVRSDFDGETHNVTS